MKKKEKNLGLIVFLVLTTVAIFVYGELYMNPRRAINNFSKIIEQGKLGEITLTIYHTDALTPFPSTIDALIRRSTSSTSGTYKIVIDGSHLEEHADIFKQLTIDAIVPVDKKSRIDARLYYIFEDKNNNKIFDVARWGRKNSIYINGIEVEENPAFYSIIIPFLPERKATHYQARVDGLTQTP